MNGTTGEKKGLKIGVAGKGGVGKTLVASTLARLAARSGTFSQVLAIDNDPSLNLGMALGIPVDEIGRPISEMRDLIKERTGAAPGESGPFKLNPRVSDIPDKFAVPGPDGVRLLVLGTIRDPGSGCLCSSNALVRELLYHLIVQRDELVVLDFEAGIESSMGRATSRGLDLLLVVVEPGQKSIQVGEKLASMAKQLNIKHVLAVVNKASDEGEARLVSERLTSKDIGVIGSIPQSRGAIEADMKGVPLLDHAPDDMAIGAIKRILDHITNQFYN
ncbi:MAG: AAA family ATPase [Candidatus Lokiarchaeota archaeon]|nr:AAA family ATPase [Candidatus Lokiarchaeota archaeon]